MLCDCNLDFIEVKRDARETKWPDRHTGCLADAHTQLKKNIEMWMEFTPRDRVLVEIEIEIESFLIHASKYCYNEAGIYETNDTVLTGIQ